MTSSILLGCLKAYISLICSKSSFMSLWTYINIKAFRRGSFIELRYTFFTYRRAELALSTVALVAGMITRMRRITSTFGNSFSIPSWAIMSSVSATLFGFDFSVAQWRFHSLSSWENDDRLGRSSLKCSNKAIYLAHRAVSICPRDWEEVSLLLLPRHFYPKTCPPVGCLGNRWMVQRWFSSSIARVCLLSHWTSMFVFLLSLAYLFHYIQPTIYPLLDLR